MVSYLNTQAILVDKYVNFIKTDVLGNRFSSVDLTKFICILFTVFSVG